MVFEVVDRGICGGAVDRLGRRALRVSSEPLHSAAPARVIHLEGGNIEDPSLPHDQQQPHSKVVRLNGIFDTILPLERHRSCVGGNHLWPQ